MKTTKILVFLLYLLTTTSAYALTTVSCSPPKGLRNYVENGKFIQGSDGYSGIHPKFIFDPDNPKKLLTLFSASKGFGKTHNDDAQTAYIIKHDERQLTAIEVQPLEVWTYSLFPNDKIAYFSRHSSSFGGAHGTTFYSKCSFSGKL